ncbi:twin-arginine translocation pathway signal [Bordetella genomosp. 5]|uniref:Twin-arginine translocation pathway signal n=1 Tax=Bordetella genomosp. 5 TaxID=1395608 RepID=A0A261TE71_9BORD|nr:YSC84-related protein [Bordetella genomosp. 5]OZI41288.1 twin-arginine translocation pathway signal [Bordetella genomosp. 5]OZI47944.1 twin-arginine translocation pathway signal [Bordetella genomosp. 5]
MLDQFPGLRRGGLAAATVALAGLVFTGCTTTSPQSTASSTSQRQEINSGADATLSKLYQTSPQAKDLVQKAKGVLVFPSVLSASFVVGAQHGKGVLRVNGANAGYYSTTAGSVGFQAGAQSKAVVLLFMTQESLDKFRNSNGWTAGADASVAVANIGANGRIDTNTAQQPIVGFVMNNTGLMAGVSLEGAKINKLDL